MAANDLWNERYNKHIRKNGVTDEEQEASQEFMANYLSGATINPRGVLTHLIPSAQYATDAEIKRYETALENGV